MSLSPPLLISLILLLSNLSPYAFLMANRLRVALLQNVSIYLLLSLIHLPRLYLSSLPNFIHLLRSSWAFHGFERLILLSIGLPWPYLFAVVAVAPCLPYFLLMLLNLLFGNSTLLRGMQPR